MTTETDERLRRWRLVLGGDEDGVTGVPASQVLAGGIPGAGVWEWLINAGGAGIFGLLLGGVIVGALHLLPGKKAAH